MAAKGRKVCFRPGTDSSAGALGKSMSTIVFEGQPCDEKPLAERGHWICQHLSRFIESIGVDEAALVTRILVGENKSTEIFVFARRPSTLGLQIIPNPAPPLVLDGSRVSCETCWSTLIFDES